MGESTEQHTLLAIYDCLFDTFGPQHWWPGETDVEVVIGAILTQNTAWTNVEKAIAAMKEQECLDLLRINEMDEDTLARIIRPAGTYRVKAKRLKAFAAWLAINHNGNLALAMAKPLTTLRKDLLSIHGIGPETADAILLYAGKHPTFVVDAYTKRILRRHGFINAGADYDHVKNLLELSLPTNPAIFNEYHALFVELAKRHCKVKANCDGCPLQSWPHKIET